MAKVIPNIYCGTKKLILSESFMFMPNDDVIVEIPIKAYKEKSIGDLKIRILFVDDGGKVSGETSLEDNVFTLKLFNSIKRPLPTGITDWFIFNIGNKKFALLIGVVPIANSSAQLTVSIYEAS